MSVQKSRVVFGSAWVVALLLAACEPSPPAGAPFAVLVLPEPTPATGGALEEGLRQGFEMIASQASLKISDSSEKFRKIDGVKYRVRMNLYCKDVAVGVEWGAPSGPHLVTFYGDAANPTARDVVDRTKEVLRARAIPFDSKVPPG